MQLLAQILSPILDDPAHIVSDWEEVGIEALAEFSADLAGILNDTSAGQVQVLQFQGDDGPVPCAREKNEGHQRAVAPLDAVLSRHGLNHKPHLIAQQGGA